MATCEHDLQDDACWQCKDVCIADLERQLAEARAMLSGFGGTCGTCGFRYWEYRGHITPCPLCERDVLKATLAQAREALNNFSQAFFEFTTAAVRDTEEPFIPQHLADLYGMLVRRAQAAEQVLGALDAGKEAER